MNLKWAARLAALSLGAIFCSFAPLPIAAQDRASQDPTLQEQAPQVQAPQDQTLQNQPPQNQMPQDRSAQDQSWLEPATRWVWPWLKQGKLSFNARYRFEGFERDGAPYTAVAFAPTLRLALGYETAAYRGFSLFAQGEAVIITGPEDYSEPTIPSQNRPNLPAILDPKSLELNQAYLKWQHGAPHKKFSTTIGRQEMTLNDGRFLSTSTWRQIHGSFDAARLDADLPWNFSFTYAFIDHFYSEVGYYAINGHPPMLTHMMNLVWNKPQKIRVALYGLLVDYTSPAQFALSSQTYGLRATGPYQFSEDWSLVYAAEFAKQMNYGSNPNLVNENYYLAELGPGWRDFSVKGGIALLGGRSATDLLTTPLAPPFNGWSELFFNDPSIAGGSGLDARYVTASGPIRFLDGAVATSTYYDYHSDYPRIHYGNELDLGMSYKVKKISNRWEVGFRFSRYWADRLYTNAIRGAIYTSFTL